MQVCGALASAGLVRGSHGGDLMGWGFWRALCLTCCPFAAPTGNGNASRGD